MFILARVFAVGVGALRGNLDDGGGPVAVVPDGMRDHPIHEYRLILAREDFFVTGDDAHFAVYDDEEVVVAVRMVVFGAAAVFLDVGNRAPQWMSPISSNSFFARKPLWPSGVMNGFSVRAFIAILPVHRISRFPLDVSTASWVAPSPNTYRSPLRV